MIKPIGGNVPTKKIPKNPKYESVKAAVDSGFNALKLSEKFDESKNNVRFRREEFFRRLKPSAFARLAEEAKVDYLLLDVREKGAFDDCHITKAVSYPAPTLTRSVNAFTSTILEYMNKEPDKIIVIYDEDEKISVPTGNLFYEKGVDNVFVISGGLRELGEKYPELIEGELPRPPSPALSSMTTKSNRSTPSTASGTTIRSGRTVGSWAANASSPASSFSAPPSRHKAAFK
eukprot:TRINITY_DN5891_c0_g1_i1.p1 TRINITY_DN5891_c0_g1~~TRINITY_DN5891_c0_g1_i1.p1  ORF type:complete len:232 (+),score=42.76 TRINITY_DN5891_c0_g1_i1:61-756(+)